LQQFSSGEVDAFPIRSSLLLVVEGLKGKEVVSDMSEYGNQVFQQAANRTTVPEGAQQPLEA
jgi:hypothetical protein